MADQKLSGLPVDTSLDDTHSFPLTDPVGPTTKRTTLGTLRAFLQSVAGWITTAMLADGAATDAKWRNLCAFRAYAPSGGNVSASGSVFTKINTLTTIEHDLGSNWSSVNQKFTAPYNGIFHANASVGVANNDVRIFASVYKNGVEYVRGGNGSYSSNANRAQVVTDLKLNSGDYVELYGWRASTGTLIAENFDGLALAVHLVTRT
jgi:hypothetical protein